MQSAVPAVLTPTQRWSAKGFGIFLTILAAALAVVSVLLAPLLRQSFLSVYAQVLFWIGLGYILASMLAWTGFANVYRYSPTLYFGSPSYRQRIVKGEMYREGRDRESLWIGSLFGLTLIGLSGLVGFVAVEGATWISFATLGAVLGLAVVLAQVALRRRTAAAADK